MRAGTPGRLRRSPFMAADPAGTDPDDRSPRERDLQRRAGAGGSMSPWLVIFAVVLLGLAVYVLSAAF